MRLREKFTDNNLFDEIGKHYNFPFIDKISADLMQLYFLNMYGERRLNNLGRNSSIENLATLLSGMFGENWTRAYDALTTEIPTLATFSETITEKIEEEGESGNNNTETTENQLSPDNTDDYFNDTKNSTVSELKGNTKNTRNREYKREGFDNDATSAIINEITLLQNNLIFDIIFSDIVRTITLSIYD